MVRTPCCKGDGLKKGAWTQEEDQKLISYVQSHGEGGWRTIPHKAGLKRCGKSCRLRWANYLRPDIKRGDFSKEEEDSIIKLHATHGNKWSAIARMLPGRTDNEVKNHWNTRIKKHLVKKGIDPLTYKSFLDASNKSSDHPETPPDKRSIHQEDGQKWSNKKSSGSSSIRFLNRVANRFGHKINQSVLSDIIGNGSPLINHTTTTTTTTSAPDGQKSMSSSLTPSSSNILINQNMTLDATSLSSSTYSASSNPLVYDNILGDIGDMMGLSSRFLSNVVSHDDKEFFMLDEFCLENTLSMRELKMILQEEDDGEGIDHFFG